MAHSCVFSWWQKNINKYCKCECTLAWNALFQWKYHVCHILIYALTLYHYGALMKIEKETWEDFYVEC